MDKPLNALILEDSQSDALLLLHALRRGGFDVNHVQVDSAAEMRAAVHDRTWDIILSDYSMPSFDALAALEIVHELKLDVPFIVISGTVGEDAAVAAMKAGATDFFAKGKLSRLVPTVERELREAAERRKRAEAEVLFATVFQASPVGIAISRWSNGQTLDVNARYLETFGYSREEMIGKNRSELALWVDPVEHELMLTKLRDTGLVKGVEVEYQHKSGTRQYVLLSAAMITFQNEPCVLSMINDITALKDSERALRASDIKFRLLAENSTDMISRLNPQGIYLYASPSSRTLLGYEPHELIGHPAYGYFHPDDLDAIMQAHQATLEQSDSSVETYRIRRKDGTYVWFETNSRAIRDVKTNEVLEIQAASRDVSRRREAEDDVRRYTERLEILHEIDRAILKRDQPQSIAESVVTRLQALMGFDSASVTAFDLDNQRFTILASIGPIPNYYPYDDMSIIERLKRNETYYVEDLMKIAEPRPSDAALIAAGIHSNIRIPLIASGGLLGSFNLQAVEPSAFSAQAVDIAREVGAQFAIAIENARLLEVEQRRTSELTALHEASLHLTSSLDMANVLDTILEYAVLLVRAYSAHVFLFDGEKLTFGAAQWQGEKQDRSLAEPRPDGLSYALVRSGERVVIPDVSQHPAYQDRRREGAFIGLPLRIGSAVVGVMGLTYEQIHPFDEYEIRVLELLADQAAIAIHNAQLYQQIQNHAADLEQRVLERTAALQASEGKYRALVEFAPDPIIIIDKTGSIVLVNRRAEESFGYQQQEMISQPIEMLLPERLNDLHVAHRAAYLAAPSKRAMGANLDLTARHKDGTEVPVKIGLSPIQTGTETLIMAYIVDISTDKHLEVTLRAALAREKELNELKTSFTSLVSHEFRTPLSVILSSTDLLINYAERMDPKRRLEKLEIITRQVRRLIKLLDDVLTITRADSTGFEYKPVPLNVVALCEEILEEVRVGYRQDIRIEFVPQGDCRVVNADEFLFSHILQNLASNAIKYSPSGGMIRVVLNCSPTEVMLGVEDQGIGIPERDQSRLFEAFRRAGNVGQIQGTGIGLTIVKRAVDACGGTIEFASLEGRGTTFTVRLPTASKDRAADDET